MCAVWTASLHSLHQPRYTINNLYYFTISVADVRIKIYTYTVRMENKKKIGKCSRVQCWCSCPWPWSSFLFMVYFCEMLLLLIWCGHIIVTETYCCPWFTFFFPTSPLNKEKVGPKFCTIEATSFQCGASIFLSCVKENSMKKMPKSIHS